MNNVQDDTSARVLDMDQVEDAILARWEDPGEDQASEDETEATSEIEEETIDEEGEEDHEQDVAPEPDPARHAAREEGRGDDGKLELKQSEQKEGKASANLRVGCGSDVAEVEEGQGVANDAAEAVPEAEAESDDDPDHADHAEGDEALQHGGDDVFAVDHAAIEEGEAGGHQQDECTGDDHPRDVAWVGLGHLLEWGGGVREGATEQGEQGQEGECDEVELLAHRAEGLAIWCGQMYEAAVGKRTPNELIVSKLIVYF